MPFETYSSYFAPEQLKALSKAYDSAWNDLRAERLTLLPNEIPVLKQKLAKLILASACSGKQNADELKQIALRGASARRGHLP